MRHAALAVLLLAACANRSGDGKKEATDMAVKKLQVQSTSFDANAKIPKKYAHADEGSNVAPSLSWSGVPEGTKSIALLCEDPDAPRPQPWIHWVVYDIPATAKEIPEGAPSGTETLSDPKGAKQGKNSWNAIGWGGPLPPPGSGTHHYHFKVFALDDSPGLKPGATKEKLLSAMKGHVLAEGEIVGTYER